MPDQYRKLIPAPVRRTLGRAYSWGVKTRTDFQTVEATCRSLAPKVLKARVRLGGKRPTVAAVFAGRNDDFVPDNEERIRAVIEWNTKVLCDEVIFVEWNPLPERPLFSTTLVKDYPTLKAFVVPPQVHTEVSENSKIPVMEYFAKNVAIRRAESEYICPTNADILWDMNVRRMARFFAPDLVFTTRRIELRWDGSSPTQEYLRDPGNIIEFRNGYRQDLAYGSGDFVLAHRDLWHRARGFDETMKGTRINCDGRGLLQLIELGASPVHMGYHYHLFHGTSSSSEGNISHGDSFRYWENLPYRNPDNWGLGDCREVQLAERVWELRL